MKVSTYLAAQYLKSALSILWFALGIYLILTYMEESQHYFDGFHPKFKSILMYYIWQSPSILAQLLPFSILVGGIVTNWLLAKHGEISALRSVGWSMQRISIPFLCVGIFFVAFQFSLDEVVIPYTSKKFQQVKSGEIEKREVANIFAKSRWLKRSQSILHYHSYDEVNQFLLLPEYILIDASVMSAKEIVHGQRAFFDKQEKRWTLENATVTQFNLKEKTVVQTLFVSRYKTEIDFEPPQVLKQGSETDQLSFWQLKKLIQEAVLAGTDVSNRLIDLHMKISLPFANLLFVFLTLPFALRKERQEENYIGVVVCLGAALVYWFGNLFLKNLSAKGLFHPFVAAWTMNFFVAVLSFSLVRKLDKGQ